VGDAVQIALMPNPDSALMLFLAAHIEAQHPTPDESYAITARCSCPGRTDPTPMGTLGVPPASAGHSGTLKPPLHSSAIGSQVE
jgi:hypothetical protein